MAADFRPSYEALPPRGFSGYESTVPEPDTDLWRNVRSFELDDPDAIREQLADILQQHGIDAAVLDAGLDLGTVASIAGALADLDIPFVLGGPDSQTEMPGYLVAQTMAPRCTG